MLSISKQGFSIGFDSAVTKYFIGDGGRNGFARSRDAGIVDKQSQCKNESSFSDAFVKMIDPETKTADPENDNSLRVSGLKNKSATVKSTVETYR